MNDFFELDRTLEEKIKYAINLLLENVPDRGFYVPFSGGKDSCVIKKLCDMSGVKYKAYYSNTTIDPPELVKFIREHHKDVIWNMPKMNMMQRVSSRYSLPPTRRMRWCCGEYKEKWGGKDEIKVMGVRGEESAARKKRWRHITEDAFGGKVLAPIVDWTEEEVWAFIRKQKIKYCKLYDEGWKRLGCIGCPLQMKEGRLREFSRWPRYGENWKRAIIKNWETFKDIPKKDGDPYFQSKFRTGEDVWNWWLNEKTPDYMRGNCQQMLLFTNEEVKDIE